MGIPFPDINPYETLGVETNATPIDIKKKYKKLCLKYHPDKIQQQQPSNTTVDQDQFAKIQFSFSILNDPNKRKRYDNTGSLAEFDVDDEGFDWKDYFESINEEITVEMIEEDKLKYQNSQEERHDIISNFIYYDGDFLKLFELIPHLEFTESEEQRVYKIIEEELPKSDVESHVIKSWEKYTKSRKTKVKQMLKRLAKEAKQAKELEAMLNNKKKTNGGDLKSIIKSRQANRLDNLISSLESKYGDKRGKKRSVKDIDDDEFERIQNDLLKRRK
ncbi:uncharacterized protein SPAPADRAFT_131825 [Spathaspora passalidarum NRRL Y-27907]|uniref:J domain-containing protein n=1 Tax=Spathaspora passalidarum (strain NRRL Y-27907 / 11-Y1) TaxID=619300 RepID=G3AEG0_SPAPN|nr:uncharacterized protein SPAPADRAFT_131825 [Spathaspora passalidarum NRRL Y-27907]EGW35748.1 hypothetical protein SPAPADRAFT_131825 [Spathaspora passalidarum NRRL Y-27907]